MCAPAGIADIARSNCSTPGNKDFLLNTCCTLASLSVFGRRLKFQPPFESGQLYSS
jgi:hypothetical protein